MPALTIIAETMLKQNMFNQGRLRHGGVLSPTLFNIVLEDVFKEIKRKSNSIGLQKNADSGKSRKCLRWRLGDIYKTKDLEINLKILEETLKN